MIPHAPFRVRRRNSQESVRNGRRYRVNRREWRVVCDRIPPAGDTLGIPVSSVIRMAERRFLRFFRGAGRTSPEELLHAARKGRGLTNCATFAHLSTPMPHAPNAIMYVISGDSYLSLATALRLA